MELEFERALEVAISKIKELLESKSSVLVAIDGRCASGKSTFAQALSKKLNATLVHMDDFYLRFDQRTSERYSIPGGNVDYERFLTEVLKPMSEGSLFLYTPFDCHSGNFKETTTVTPQKVCIAEGSYSCHPELYSYYDLHIFMDVDSNTQIKRLLLREGENKTRQFLERWIPLEEKYFTAFHIKQKSELYFLINEV